MHVRQEPYHELGANDLDEHQWHHPVDHLTRRIESLGYHVALERRPTAATWDFFRVTTN
jgi:hypothetical protein